MSSDLRLLDQNVQIPLLSQMSCGQLGEGTASPKDIRPSSSFDRPASILVHDETGEFGPADDLSLIVNRGFPACDEPKGPLGENPGI